MLELFERNYSRHLLSFRKNQAIEKLSGATSHVVEIMGMSLIQVRQFKSLI